LKHALLLAFAILPAAAAPRDRTPPTTPTNLRVTGTTSYEVYVNDVYDHSTSLLFTRTIVYGTQNGPNTFKVAAVDTAGKRSEPAELTADLTCQP